MLTLVRHARRRLLCNELFSQGATAVCAALLAFILLLLLGTQILSWRWLVLIPLVALAWGIHRVRRRMPSFYSTAQLLDRRLDLADTLSTALFFSECAPAPKGSEEIRRLQYERADRLARSLDARAAVPYVMPRAGYAMAALFLVASSLFALRYGLNRRLDLKPPLARILQQTFGFEEKTEQARNVKKNLPPELQPRPDDSGDAVEDRDRDTGEIKEDGLSVSDEPTDSQNASGDSKKAVSDAKKEGDEGVKADADPNDGEGEEREAGEGERSGEGKQGSQADQKQESGNKQDANTSNENSSLMSKVKDAWQNLMSRMKPQQGQSGSQQSSMDQKGNQKGQQGGKQQASKDAQKQNGGQPSDAQEGQAGEEAQSSQDAQGKGAGKSDSPQTSKQPGSGIGSQDGDKNIKQAEQLAAMGKISEILGKRSATITGESTVEVQNTSQQLHTPYAQRGVQHTQGGAEINRDEVPVALQAYVESYFEQVRKQPAAPAKKQ